MSFPQLSATAPLLLGQQYSRILTELSSAGDIYESEVSAMGLVLGPNSDLGNVRVSSFDAVLPGGVSQVVMSPDRNFVGRVDARGDTTYIKSRSRKGRLLITVDDIYSPQWRPAGFDPTALTGDQWTIVPPTLDVLQYFSELPSVIPPRSDKTFHFGALKSPPGALKISNLAIPCYGRKSGSIAFKNDNGLGAAVNYALKAVRFALATNAAGTVYQGVEATLVATVSVADGATSLFQYNSSTHGSWDYFFFQLGGAAPNSYNGSAVQIHATLSDDR